MSEITCRKDRCVYCENYVCSKDKVIISKEQRCLNYETRRVYGGDV